MPSTYSPDLRIELVGNGEQSGVWGLTTNNNLGSLIEQAIAGVELISVPTSPYALTIRDGVTDEARNAMLRLTGASADYEVFIPPVQKLYTIKNQTAYTCTVRVSSVAGNTTWNGGGFVVILPGRVVQVYCDDSNIDDAVDMVMDGFTVVGDLSVDGDASVTGGLAFDGSLSAGTRLAGTYTQTGTTVTVTTGSDHGFTTGDTVAFINVSGLGVSGAYIITVTSTVIFTFTSAVSQATSGNCLVTKDAVTLNGIITPGAIIEGSSTLPALRVTQTGTGLALLVEDSANPDTTAFAITAAGNVGIGTNAPSQLLDIVSETVTIDQISRYSTDVSAPARVIRKARGTVAAPTIVADDDAAGTTVFQAYDGVAFQPVAQIRAEIDGTPGAGDMPGRLILSTTPDGAAALVDRITVDNAGNVVIGSGEAGATPVGNTLRAPSAAGTDKAGSNLVIQSGNGTGTGLSGSITLQTANPTATGTTAGTMVDRLKVQQNGLMLGQYSTMGAGVVPSESFYRLYTAFVGSNVATAQSLFGVGIPLAASTTYEFEIVCALQRTAGTTSHNISLLFNIGSGTFVDIAYYVNGVFKPNPTTTVTAPDVCLYAQVATAIPICSSTTSPTISFMGVIKGTFSVGTAGIWTPQYQLSSAPGGAYTTLAGSYIKLNPIGPSGSNVNVGGWA